MYIPQSLGDTGLYSPVSDSISHITFCWRFELDVEKTAVTTFTRDFDWTIVKSNDSGSSETDPLEVQENQPIDVEYAATITKDDGTDSDWAVSGTITIENNTPLSATITSVSDSISGFGAVTANCGVTFPYVLAAGGELVCTYSSALPDGSSRTNTATALTSGDVDGNTATAGVTFGAPSTVEDDCVLITDDDFEAEFIDQNDLYDGEDDDQVEVCENAVLTYTVTFNTEDHPLECGDNVIENTARLSTDDGLDETSDSTVWITRHCETTEGCTLTPGYWKTHSIYGPAAHPDATWDLLPGGLGPNKQFFISGKTWYQALWTAPQGNPYYILAHAYIAAKLNILAGASTTAGVDAAITYAETYFPTKNPNTNTTGPTKTAVLNAAKTLDDYNNGLIGPGHCDGDVI